MFGRAHRRKTQPQAETYRGWAARVSSMDSSTKPGATAAPNFHFIPVPA